MSAYLRRTYREGGKVRNETVANLSTLPAEAVDAIEATLKGKRLVPAGAGGHASPGRCRTGTWPRSRRWRTQLGLPALLGPAGPAAGPGDGADRLAGGAARLETVHR